jgi:antitoxin ParD1/3/4
MQRPGKHLDIEAVRRQAAESGLRFEAYLPPRLAEWVIALVDQGDFHSPSEAVFVAMQSFRELNEHPDLKQELLKRAIQKGIDISERGRGHSS